MLLGHEKLYPYGTGQVFHTVLVHGAVIQGNISNGGRV
jgi:hypothetical protein